MNKSTPRLKIILLVIPILGTISFIFFYQKKVDFITINQETLGQIGDYFGGLLNPLISYCGLVAIILTLMNAIKDSASIQARHIEGLYQSNAINLLQIFKDILDGIRNQRGSNPSFGPLKELLRLSAEPDQNLTEEVKNNILKYTYQIDIQWGICSRYISLLSELNANADRFQKIIFDSAIALLNNDELEKILCCLAAMNEKDLANNIILSNNKRINENITKTIEMISRTSTASKN